MAKGIHKGTEYNNVNETWDQNERNLAREDVPGQKEVTSGGNTGSRDLDQTIKEEATEYDTTKKEDQLLSGDRASLNDDE
ncbi:MAG TPA: hypothetical protein VD794_12265 [Flavisolibacter sp.]|nr:hypothetical protein [Flavisolibacter sp.]